MNDPAAFNDSFERVVAQNFDQFFLLFYEKLSAVSPDIAAVFANTPESRRYEMLADSILMLMDFNTSHEPSKELHQLASIHKRIGVKPDFYERWLDSLLATVATLDPMFGEHTELAWRATLAPGVRFMIKFGSAATE